MLELAEAAAAGELLEAQPRRVRRELGIATAHLGGGVVTAVRADPTRYWSRAVGLGFAGPVTRAVVGEITAFWRAQGVPQGRIQLAPEVVPDDMAEIVAAQALAPGPVALKLAGRAEDVPPARTALRVTEIAPREAGAWSAAVCAAYELPEVLAPLWAPAAGHPRFVALGAWDGRELVAGALLHVSGEMGELAGAATLPGHRGRGAQSALLAARAAASGSRSLVAETGAEPGNRSLRNLRRAGLRVRYERPSWIWRC
ncbi:GNAT superfamily N-acetyltransferase [Amycolatopsis bartoniae]|uniref:GNAT family N-acetyltransferase n=1 Tax=Amycolatopsis bartoniae TaxID=941986 RepID=A0A8H9ITE6_9PSEU|nr:GNAT family N-acetyltransferase [Amycolatopsis bartoniae]MBB2939603.1 GNAT superfamily N-acetyltransferase [Amycolatopsis bartoniae]TVT07812.1 GNAT family N-acetyltransferase [Amycolatopsis bartoniae]GHF39546.1 hypothetical protein GCM10017566_11050 [Amycolatopsis bartoniae]